MPSLDRGNDTGVGRRLGRYELLYEIASGGMATVYLARVVGMKGFERVVAVKCCHPHLRHDEDFATMFLDEARLAAQIHHPNVVATLDVGDDGALYLAMEYVEGDRLLGLWKAARKRGERIPIGVSLRLMMDALNGLHAAHELKDADGVPLNLVHRDVSPQNILVGVDGAARITDFGIAKAEQRATVTREGQIKGKVSYMAPEQFVAGAVTRRADVFAAAIVLWEMLTGHRLFRADSDAETLNMVLHGTMPPASKHAPEVTPELDAVLGKALEREPANRYATAADFADALETCGVKIATGRIVASYVEGLIGPAVEQRRAILQQVRQGIVPVRREHEEVSASKSIERPPPRAAQPVSDAPADESSVLRTAERPARGNRWLAIVVVGLVALAAAGGIAFGRRDHGAARTAPAPQPTATVPTPPATPPVPPTVAPTPVPQSHETVPPPVATAAAIERADAGVSPAPGTVNRTPRAGRRTGGHTPAPGTPAGNPPNEFHPGAL